MNALPACRPIICPTSNKPPNKQGTEKAFIPTTSTKKRTAAYRGPNAFRAVRWLSKSVPSKKWLARRSLNTLTDWEHHSIEARLFRSYSPCNQTITHLTERVRWLHGTGRLNLQEKTVTWRKENKRDQQSHHICHKRARRLQLSMVKRWSHIWT